MKKTLILASLLVAALCCYPQDQKLPAQLIEGEVLSTENNYHVVSFIGQIGDNTYFQTADQKSNYIIKLNTDMMIDKSVSLGEWTFKRTTKRFRFARIVCNRLFVFYQDDKTNGKESHIQEHDINTLDLKGTGLPYEEWDNPNDHKIPTSPDGKKALVIMKMNETNTIRLKVCNSDLSLDWDREFKGGGGKNRELYNAEDIKIDNGGNVYVLSQEFFGSPDLSKKKLPNYVYHVTCYSKTGEPSDIIIKHDSKFLSMDKLEFNSAGELIAAGYSGGRYFYNVDDIKDVYTVTGSYYMRIDTKTKKVLAEKQTDFSIDFLSLDMTEKQKKDEEKEMVGGENMGLGHQFRFASKGMIILSNGNTVLLGDQRDSHGVKAIDEEKYHYSFSITAVCLTPTGEIAWATKIPKLQRAIGEPTSYTYGFCNNKIYFVFNDNLKNTKGPALRDPYEFKIKGTLGLNTAGETYVLSIVALDASGEFKRQELLRLKDSEWLVVGTTSEPQYWLGNTCKILLYMYDNGKYRFPIVQLK